MMRVSKMTVYRLVHAGELSAVRVGRSFRVPERAVQEYLRDAFTECLTRPEVAEHEVVWSGPAAAAAAGRPGTLSRRVRPEPRYVRAVDRWHADHRATTSGVLMGSVIKKRRKRMAKKKHRKLLKKTRVQRRNKK